MSGWHWTAYSLFSVMTCVIIGLASKLYEAVSVGRAAYAHSQERARRFKRMADCIGKMCGVSYDSEFTRASHMAICDICGLTLGEHPETGIPGLTIVCDGRVVHL